MVIYYYYFFFFVNYFEIHFRCLDFAFAPTHRDLLRAAATYLYVFIYDYF